MCSRIIQCIQECGVVFVLPLLLFHHFLHYLNVSVSLFGARHSILKVHMEICVSKHARCIQHVALYTVYVTNMVTVAMATVPMLETPYK